MNWLKDLLIEDYPETVTNFYTEESCELVPEAVAVYDFIRGCELLKDIKHFEEALSYFRNKWPKEYYILLD